jgi:hypothetical protein
MGARFVRASSSNTIPGLDFKTGLPLNQPLIWVIAALTVQAQD